jgi:uncharacterized membrane protein YGL010W
MLRGSPSKATAMDASVPHEHGIDRWFARYSDDHQDPVNQAIHVVAVPAILWSVVALLWCVPPPGTLFRPGIWAAMAMFAAWLFYLRASRPIATGMLAVFALCAASCWLLAGAFGLRALGWLAAVVFVVAWIAQFLGHRVEGRRPSFLTDLTYLLVGPAWVLAKLYRRLGWRW